MGVPRSLRRWFHGAATAALVLLATVAKADPAETARRLKAVCADGAIRERIQRSIGRGTAFLLQRQGADGWFAEHGTLDWDAAYMRDGVSLLCSLALRHAGEPPTSPAIRRAISAIFADEPKAIRRIERRIYETSLALMLVEAVPGHESAAREFVAALVRGLDEQSGLWGYDAPGGDERYGPDRLAPAGRDSPNLSTSQFAVLGLAAAARMELPVPPRIWIRHAAALCAMQTANGSWPYGPDRAPSDPTTVTSTYMGLADLLFAAEKMAAAKEIPKGLTERVASAIQKARKALARGALKTIAGPGAVMADVDDGVTAPTFRAPGSRRHAIPGVGANYTLFAFEKACLFGNVVEFDAAPPPVSAPNVAPGRKATERKPELTPAKSWYVTCAEWLLATQRADGGWPSSGGDPAAEVSSEIDSALALLFLTRAPSVFHPTTPAEIDAKPGGGVTPSEPTSPGK